MELHPDSMLAVSCDHILPGRWLGGVPSAVPCRCRHPFTRRHTQSDPRTTGRRLTSEHPLELGYLFSYPGIGVFWIVWRRIFPQVFFAQPIVHRPLCVQRAPVARPILIRLRRVAIPRVRAPVRPFVGPVTSCVSFCSRSGATDFFLLAESL